MSRRSLLLVLVAVAVIPAVAWIAIGRGGAGNPPGVAEHPTAIPSTERAVYVSTTMPAPSSSARRLSAMLESGTMPDVGTMAEVMSDTECAPDAHMLSRCRNEMRLPDGRTIVLRHPHDMRHVPCLAPGERVMLVPAA